MAFTNKLSNEEARMAIFPKLPVPGHTHFAHDVGRAFEVEMERSYLGGIAKAIFAPGATTTSLAHFQHVRKIDQTLLIKIRKVVMVSHHHTRIVNRAWWQSDGIRRRADFFSLRMVENANAVRTAVRGQRRVPLLEKCIDRINYVCRPASDRPYPTRAHVAERLVINEFSPTHTAAHSKSYSQNQRNNYLMSNFHMYHYTTNLPKPERGKSDAQAVTNAQTSLLQRFRGVCPRLFHG